MNSATMRYRAIALACTFLFVISIFAFLSPRVDAFPKHVIRRTKEEQKQKQETAKKEEEKKDDSSSSSSSSSSHKKKDKEYVHIRDHSYDTHYSYYSPTYDRVVDIYFNEAYARLNEGFFYDEEKDIEYLPGEWFDIFLGFDCYAVVPGEDVKITYTVLSMDNEKLLWGKEFRSIFAGSNDKNLFRVIPRGLLEHYGKIYVDVVLTIEGNNAYGGFWLETVPQGNEGPLRIGDVVVALPVPGGESNPVYNLIEGNEYKLIVEYQVDHYLGESAVVEWELYDANGKDIVTGIDYIDPRAGFGYYVKHFRIPNVSFIETMACLLDVRITASPYLGRRILEINVTSYNDPIYPEPAGTGIDGVSYEGQSPYDVMFTYFNIVAVGESTGITRFNTSQDLFVLADYHISGLRDQAEETILYKLSTPGGPSKTGKLIGSVENGDQNRSIKLPIERDFPAGQYTLEIELLLNGIPSGSRELIFDLERPSGDIRIEVGGADENFFEFEGFNMSLPYKWDVEETDSCLAISTNSGIDGRVLQRTFDWENSGDVTLTDAVAVVEKDQTNVLLTRKKYFAGGREILSSLFLYSPDDGTEYATLHGYFICNQTEDSFDFCMLALMGDPDEISDLYDTFDITLDGLSFTDK